MFLYYLIMTLDKEKTNFDYYWIHRSSV